MDIQTKVILRTKEVLTLPDLPDDLSFFYELEKERRKADGTLTLIGVDGHAARVKAKDIVSVELVATYN